MNNGVKGLLKPMEIFAQENEGFQGLNPAEFYRYKLVIYPEGEAGSRVRDLVKEFQMLSRKGIRVFQKPCISLALFRARDLMEDTLIRWIQRICNNHRRFQVTLNNFGSATPDGLFLRIMDPGPFGELVSKLRVIENYIHSNTPGKINWVLKPSCMIAEGLEHEDWFQYIQGILKKDFHVSFTAYNLVLLRESANGLDDQVVNVFPLFP